MGYQTLVNEIDEWCCGDLDEMDRFATFLNDYLVQARMNASEDQMYIHGFCD